LIDGRLIGITLYSLTCMTIDFEWLLCRNEILLVFIWITLVAWKDIVLVHFGIEKKNSEFSWIFNKNVVWLIKWELTIQTKVHLKYPKPSQIQTNDPKIRQHIKDIFHLSPTKSKILLSSSAIWQGRGCLHFSLYWCCIKKYFLWHLLSLSLIRACRMKMIKICRFYEEENILA